MESYVMTVVCSSHPSSLARIVSVLHARRADIGALRYVSGVCSSEVFIEVRGADRTRLPAQLRRVVGVLSVDVAAPASVVVPASMAVAS